MERERRCGAPPPRCCSAAQSVETALFCRLLSCVCDTIMFSVLEMAHDGGCSILYVSPGVRRLLGYTPEEYTALGCARSAHSACSARCARAQRSDSAQRSGSAQRSNSRAQCAQRAAAASVGFAMRVASARARARPLLLR
jgi:hypothetical protein